MRKTNPEKEQIHLLNLGDGTGNIRPRHLKDGKSPQRLRILDQLDHLQLRRGTQFHPSQLRCLRHKGGNDLRIHVQQMLQRIVHHRNQAENDGDLDQHGDHPHHGTVVLALVKRHLLSAALSLFPTWRAMIWLTSGWSFTILMEFFCTQILMGNKITLVKTVKSMIANP